MSILLLAVALQLEEKPPAPSVAPPLIRIRPSPPPPPPPPPPTPVARRARMMATLATVVTEEDYPVEALRNEEQGTAVYRVAVGIDGRVLGCRIVGSSGSASLDETTCRIIRARARFTPAIGLDGRPAPDVAIGRITWRLADEPEPEAAAAGDGPPAASRPTHRARPVAPLASHVTAEDFPAAARGGSSPGTSRFRLSVAADGRVAGCETILSSGSPLLDEAACRLILRRSRFTPARDAAGHAVADEHWGHINWRDFGGPPGPPAPPVPVSAPPPRPENGAAQRLDENS